MQAGDAAVIPVKRDKRGHPTSVKSWTPRTVCGSLHVERVSEVQRRLSGGGETKDIGQYGRALAEVFGELSEDELEQCTTLAEQWNADVPSEEVQRRWDADYNGYEPS